MFSLTSSFWLKLKKIKVLSHYIFINKFLISNGKDKKLEKNGLILKN